MIRQSHDTEHRKKLAELRREIKALEAPGTAAGRKARRDARKARQKAIGKPAEGQRQPRVHDALYLAWIRGLPCVACAVEQTGGRSLRCEAAHVRAGYAEAGWRPTGMGEKPDDKGRTAPLCSSHHREGPKAQHATGERAWWEAIGIYPPSLCSALARAYDTNEDGAAVIRRFANDSSKLGLVDVASSRRNGQ